MKHFGTSLKTHKMYAIYLMRNDDCDVVHEIPWKRRKRFIQTDLKYS